MTAKKLPIGVDLGYSRLRMAQLRSSETVELLAAASARIPSECREDLDGRLKFQSRSIQGLLKSMGFGGRKAIMSLPAAATFLQPVKIPLSRSAQADQIIKDELQGKLPFPAEEAVIRHILADTIHSEGEQMQEHIVVAAHRPTLDAHMDMASSAGLEVVGINVQACAVVECFARFFRRSGDADHARLFIDIGSASTQVVLARGRQMVFARNLTVGGLTLDEALAQTMQIPIEKAGHLRRKLLTEDRDSEAENDLFRLLDTKIGQITDEIIHCVQYYESVFRNDAIECVIFVGGEAHNKRLCQCIARRLALPAQVGDPMARVQGTLQVLEPIGLDARNPQPAWAVAVGLSLGAEMVA